MSTDDLIPTASSSSTEFYAIRSRYLLKAIKFSSFAFSAVYSLYILAVITRAFWNDEKSMRVLILTSLRVMPMLLAPFLFKRYIGSHHLMYIATAIVCVLLSYDVFDVLIMGPYSDPSSPEFALAYGTVLCSIQMPLYFALYRLPLTHMGIIAASYAISSTIAMYNLSQLLISVIARFFILLFIGGFASMMSFSLSQVDYQVCGML